jgi:hypothetical protein
MIAPALNALGTIPISPLSGSAVVWGARAAESSAGRRGRLGVGEAAIWLLLVHTSAYAGDNDGSCSSFLNPASKSRRHLR